MSERTTKENFHDPKALTGAKIIEVDLENEEEDPQEHPAGAGATDGDQELAGKPRSDKPKNIEEVTPSSLEKPVDSFNLPDLQSPRNEGGGQVSIDESISVRSTSPMILQSSMQKFSQMNNTKANFSKIKLP